MSVGIAKFVLTNTKGRPFDVVGKVWSDGVVMCHNPRPGRYPDFKTLRTSPEDYYENDPKRLYWDDGSLSPFRIQSMLLTLHKKPRKKTGS